MKGQNATKRTLISFSIALLTAITAFNIQQSKKEKQSLSEDKLEAKVYPITRAHLSK